MNDESNPSSPPAAGVEASRKPWTKPQVTMLAVEETATAATSNNDGQGPLTSS